MLYLFESQHFPQGPAHTMCMEQKGKDLYICAFAAVHSDMMLVSEAH